MKKILLLSMALIMSIAVIAQKPQIQKHLRVAKNVTEQKIAFEPEKSFGMKTIAPLPSGPKASSGIVTVITLGTSANANGYGYRGGQKTMVWADDSLGTIINMHRMGPGTSPPSLSGYLAVDKAINQGTVTGDWTLNEQVYAATLNSSGTYYLDAARYPQAGIYNPPGNTDPNNSYIAYFAANLSKNSTTAPWGGYSFGVCKWLYEQPGDSTKHMWWFNPPPSQYIPDGMTISHKGVSIVTDLDRDWETGTGAYMGDVIVNRGVWNPTTKDFDYEQFMVPLPVMDNNYPPDNRIAASPDGNVMWMATCSNNGGTVNIGDSATYYPILNKSVDGGLTWSDPISIQLDGPDGIDGVKNALSDNLLMTIFGVLPSRDEVPYTTDWGGIDMVVDKWGNPHIGVVIGVAGDNQYSIYADGDSLLTVFDIYSTDGGNTWQGQKMGSLRLWDHNFATASAPFVEYNRVNMAINESGDHVFVTWLDTHKDGATENTDPDVFARGFNLLENKITSVDGEDISNNVTFLSEIWQLAFFQCTSHYVFSKEGGGHTIPIVTELLSDPEDPAQPVEFKYISDFSYMPADYTIASTNPPFPVGIDDNRKELTMNATLSPNPVQDIATLTVNMQQGGNLNIEVTNMTGQKMMAFDKGFVNSGSHQFTIDASGLQAGVYFCTIKLNDQKFTSKMVVR